MNEPATYISFLVRLWQDSPNAPWRASAQSAETGEIVRFAELPALCAFLNAQAIDSPAKAPPRNTWF